MIATALLPLQLINWSSFNNAGAVALAGELAAATSTGCVGDGELHITNATKTTNNFVIN